MYVKTRPQDEKREQLHEEVLKQQQSIKSRHAEELDAVRAELIRCQRDKQDDQIALSLEHERELMEKEIQKLQEENEQLRNARDLRLSAKLPAFSKNSDVYERFCTGQGFQYSIKGIHETCVGENLLRVAIQAARSNQHLLPVE